MGIEVNFQFFSFLFDKIYKKFHKTLWKFHKSLWKSHKHSWKTHKKFHLSCFSPTSYQWRRNMGHFKNPLWCTVEKTQGAKIQNWGWPHKLTSLRSSWKKDLSIFMHRVQRYKSAKSCSWSLNTLYQLTGLHLG